MSAERPDTISISIPCIHCGARKVYWHHSNLSWRCGACGEQTTASWTVNE